MTGYTSAEIWVIVVALAVGTYVIRLSFLGFIRPDSLPPVILRMLRYTPVAVLPAMVAPLVVWPDGTESRADPLSICAAGITLLVGWSTKKAIWAAIAGGATLTLGRLAGV